MRNNFADNVPASDKLSHRARSQSDHPLNFSMRIVFIDTTLTMPPSGGATTFLVELCTALAARGDRVTVVAQPGPEQSVARRLLAARVEVRQDLWRTAHLPEERAALLARWIHSQQVDVFVISISADAGWVALPLLEPSIATMSIAHADIAAFYDPLKHYAPFIDCAVGVSEAIHRRIIGQCSIPPARAHHVPYGVTSLLSEEITVRRARQFELDEPLRIGYLGRLVQGHKRVLDLVPLAKELERRGIPFELHLLGDGSERLALESGFEKSGVTRNIKFWGWLTPEAVRQRLRALDAMVLLSDSEGLPLALLESMGHGVVPVVTNLEGGLTEVVKEGENGFLVAVGDIGAFADRFELLAGDRERLSLMRQAAWETSQDYSLERMVQWYVQTFQEAAEQTFGRKQRDGVNNQYPVMPSCRSKYPFWLRKVKSYMLALNSQTRSAPHVQSLNNR
jgi:glycosyltransferase involved in cell wall biosynthesis